MRAGTCPVSPLTLWLSVQGQAHSLPYFSFGLEINKKSIWQVIFADEFYQIESLN